MRRKVLLPLLVLFVASAAFARNRSASSGSGQADARVGGHGATVSGIVTSVGGNLIRLAGGLIAIDATGARISVDREMNPTIADIEPGMMVFALLKSSDAPLVASTVTATSLHDAGLSGPVQSVDLVANSFKLVGLTIFVNADTSFGGFARNGQPTLADLLPNQVVQVSVDATGGKLIATTVLILSFTPPTVKSAHGTVKSIAPDSWVITREREGDLTLVVNAQTKIIGSPKVGDAVEVLYSIDSSNANVAISIIRFERPSSNTIVFRGTVKAIAATSWTIDARKVLINERTRIQNGIVVGDMVEVVAQKNDQGELVALVIVKKR